MMAPHILSRLLLRLRQFTISLRGLYAFRYWGGQLRLMRVMAHPGLAGLVRRRPRVLFKYLHPRYLAYGFDSASRLAALTHHYACLAGAFRVPFLHTQLAQGLVLWRLAPEPHAPRITLAYSDRDLEGDLMFAFRQDEEWIYTISVTLVHGGVTEPGGASAALITGMQGAAGKLELIRQATRACADIAPPYLLLAALKGLAAVLGIERILAAGNTRQLAKAAGRAMFDYDRFWASAGGVPTGDGFYQIPAALPDPPAPSPSESLSREGRRRQLKRGVAAAAAAMLRQCMRAPPRPVS